jgi:uncharacterized repeat protein (TIGR03803 family)
LVTALVVILAGPVTAQNFTVLHNFTATPAPSFTNSDGAGPNELILSSNILYGTASVGGSSGNGTVFALNTAGTDFTVLHSFIATDVNGNNRDGADPHAGLVLSGNTLYGTARDGGNSGDGTVFAVNTKTIAFQLVYTFTATDANGNNNDGASPQATLILSSNTLYGTASDGGIWGEGTVFAVNATGTGFTPLHSFTATDANGNNSDGANPQAILILSSNTLYGTASGGGNSGNGTVFAIDTETTAFTLLHSFTATDANGVNSDGALPNGLILSSHTLYGTASLGGSSANGMVFRVNADGTGFTNLYNFSTVRTNTLGVYTNCLDHQPSGPRRRKWAEHGHKSNFGNTAVFPVEPVSSIFWLRSWWDCRIDSAAKRAKKDFGVDQGGSIGTARGKGTTVVVPCKVFSFSP